MLRDVSPRVRRSPTGSANDFAYGYNVDGTLQSRTYPSNRVVNCTYDAAGRPRVTTA